MFESLTSQVDVLYNLMPGIIGKEYFFVAVTFIILYFISKLVLLVFKIITNFIGRKTKTEFDDKLFSIVKRPASWLLTMVALRIALLPLQAAKMWAIISNVVDSVIILAVAYVMINVLDLVIRIYGTKLAERTKSTIDDALIPIAHKTNKIVILVLAIIIIFTEWNVNITGFIAGLGIAGLAVGLALQPTLSNIFSGISLVLDKSIKVGDRLELLDGTVGIVTDITIRSTKVKTFSNELIIVPNGQLANQQIKNHSRPNLKARGDVLFGVEYGTDIDKVKDVLLREIKKLDKVIANPEPVVLFLEMGDSALNFKASFWVDDISDRYETKLIVTDLVYNTLNKNKIGIPFPTRTIYMKK